MTTSISAPDAQPTSGVLRQDQTPGTGQKSELSASLSKAPGNVSSEPGSATDASLVVSAEEFLNSIDELSAFISLVRNRREIEKRNDFSSAIDNYDLLEDDAQPRIDALWRVLQVDDTKKFALFLRELHQQFPDESDRVVVLRQMLRQRNISKTERELIEEALADIEEHANPKHLKSGINVALKARLFGKPLGLSPAVIRQSYRDFIESEQTEHSIYLNWVMLFGARRRQMLIEFMESALLADMNASDPGCSEREFGDLLGRLAQIKIIRSSDAKFIAGARTDSLLASFSLSEEQWLLFLLPVLNDAALLNHQLQQLGDGVIYQQPAGDQVRLLQKIYQLVKTLSVHIYSSDDQQQSVQQRFLCLIEEGYKQELAARRK